MALPVYPANINFEAERETFREALSQGQSIGFVPEQGLSITRPNSAIPLYDLSYSVIMPEAQYQIWLAWFIDPINGTGKGNLRHTQPHPVTGVNGTFRYDPDNPPQAEDVGFATKRLNITIKKIG